jgi:hypothetical protein
VPLVRFLKIAFSMHNEVYLICRLHLVDRIPLHGLTPIEVGSFVNSDLEISDYQKDVFQKLPTISNIAK